MATTDSKSKEVRLVNMLIVLLAAAILTLLCLMFTNTGGSLGSLLSSTDTKKPATQAGKHDIKISRYL